jgi:hypothetical protein
VLARAQLAISSRNDSAAASLLQQVRAAAPELWNDQLQRTLDSISGSPGTVPRGSSGVTRGSGVAGTGWSEPQL